MNLNAAALLIMAAKGLTLEDVAEIVAASQRPVPAPRKPKELPPPTSHRKGSGWRLKAYAELVERDGPVCAQCGCAERTIWRKAGLQNNDDWGVCEDGRCISYFSGVNPSSNLEVDHLKPLRDGGTNCLSNLWLLCVQCHRKKTSAEHSDRLRRMFAEGGQ